MIVLRHAIEWLSCHTPLHLAACHWRPAFRLQQRPGEGGGGGCGGRNSTALSSFVFVVGLSSGSFFSLACWLLNLDYPALQARVRRFTGADRADWGYPLLKNLPRLSPSLPLPLSPPPLFTPPPPPPPPHLSLSSSQSYSRLHDRAHPAGTEIGGEKMSLACTDQYDLG